MILLHGEYMDHRLGISVNLDNEGDKVVKCFPTAFTTLDAFPFVCFLLNYTVRIVQEGHMSVSRE